VTTLDYLFRNQRKTALPSHTNRCLCLHCRLLALTVNASFYSLEGERSRSSAEQRNIGREQGWKNLVFLRKSFKVFKEFFDF